MGSGNNKRQGRGESPTSPRILLANERQRRALEMRKAGASYQMIADNLGLAVSGAEKAVKSALRKITMEPAREVLKIELARLDSMILKMWPKVAKDGDVEALDRVLKIMDRRAKYLKLDAPLRHELTGKDGKPLGEPQQIRNNEKLAEIIRTIRKSEAGRALQLQEGGNGDPAGDNRGP